MPFVAKNLLTLPRYFSITRSGCCRHAGHWRRSARAATVDKMFETTMKKTFYAVLAMVAVLALASCNDYETYGEKKEKEQDAINAFISEEGIKVIGEDQFHAQGDSTSVEDNEFVYLDNSGVYMQIVRKGCGDELEEKKQVNVLCRYTEYNILDRAMQTRNDYDARNYDKMTVVRTGATYTASFVSGVMYSTYGSSVPTGWLVPFTYINIGRQNTPGEEIAMVKLIVPHSQGQTYASTNVYPCYYVITYQRER